MTEPLTLAQPVWPLNGYAPGGYTCICCTCDKHFDGDKRATTCLECAVTRLTAVNKALTDERDKWREAFSGMHRQTMDAEAKLAKVEAERERLALAICGGEDAPGYANAQTVETLEQVARDNNRDHNAAIDRAASLSAELAEARKVIEPFATYLDQAAFDLDNEGQPLADEQGMGWVYLTIGDFRRARSFLASKEAGQ